MHNLPFLFLPFFPVGKELLHADVGQWMLGQLGDHFIRDGRDISSEQGRLDHMHRAADRGDNDLGGETVVAQYCHYIGNQIKTVYRNIVKPADKRADIGRPGLGRQQSL